MKKILIIIIFSLFVSGCSLLDNEIEITHEIEFKNDKTVEYQKDKMQSSKLIVSVDGMTISESNIENDRIYVSNFYVECPNIKNELGKQTISYMIGDEEHSIEINVIDKQKPNLTLQKNHYDINENEQLSLNEIKYEVKDNYTSHENIKVSLKKVSDTIYRIYAEDENGNSAYKEISVNVIKNDKKDKNSSNQKDSVNDSSSKTVQKKQSTSKKSNSSDKSSSKKKSSSYNKFFDGKSINNYNKAKAYAESILKNHSEVKGYEVMPTGDGYKVTFK